MVNGPFDKAHDGIGWKWQIPDQKLGNQKVLQIASCYHFFQIPQLLTVAHSLPGMHELVGKRIPEKRPLINMAICFSFTTNPLIYPHTHDN